MKIFISSTYTSLKSERKKVIEHLMKIGHEPIAMEYFSADVEPPLEECLSRVEVSDLLVLVLGPTYGSIDPETGVSVTENEYRHAKELGIEVIAFREDSLDSKIASANPPDATDKYRRFLSDVKTSSTLDRFSNADELAANVGAAIHNYQRDHGELGRRASVFVTGEEYFRPWLDSGRYLSHAWQLVGRQHTLQELAEFVAGNRRVGLLYGAGGIGKSKILFEYSRSRDERKAGWNLRFVRESVPWSPDALRGLGADPTLIIVDDAQRYSDLSQLLGLLDQEQYAARTKILLAARPSGRAEIESLLFRSVDPSIVTVFQTLKSLSQDDVFTLVNQALGSESKGYANRLFRISWDCPLVTVVGGRLITEKKIAPELFPSDEDFRRAVLIRFTDEITLALGEPRDLWRRILSLISALAPVRPANDAFREQAGKFLGVDPVDLFKRIGRLEECGMLFRRGGLVWISPDVLADYILQDECMSTMNENTGYAGKVFAEFAPTHAKNLLRNLAEVQWRIDAINGGPKLLEPIWQDIFKAFRSADYAGRIRLLEMIEPAAAFQPEHALALAREAIGLA